jgi:hypothetical protein
MTPHSELLEVTVRLISLQSEVSTSTRKSKRVGKVDSSWGFRGHLVHSLPRRILDM